MPSISAATSLLQRLEPDVDRRERRRFRLRFLCLWRGGAVGTTARQTTRTIIQGRRHARIGISLN